MGIVPKLRIRNPVPRPFARNPANLPTYGGRDWWKPHPLHQPHHNMLVSPWRFVNDSPVSLVCTMWKFTDTGRVRAAGKPSDEPLRKGETQSPTDIHLDVSVHGVALRTVTQ